MDKAKPAVIGRVVKIDLVDLELSNVPAKVDTGADSSTIWAGSVKETKGGLACVFFGPGNPYYTGKEIVFKKGSYSLTRVVSSFGHKELRYKVKMRVRIEGRLIMASFTLADRSLKPYPILIGRRLLNRKFLVDVSRLKRG